MLRTTRKVRSQWDKLQSKKSKALYHETKSKANQELHAQKTSIITEFIILLGLFSLFHNQKREQYLATTAHIAENTIALTLENNQYSTGMRY